MSTLKVDNIRPLSAATVDGAEYLKFVQSGTAPLSQTMQDKARKIIHASDYTGWDATGVSDSTTALTNAIAAAVAAGYDTVRVNGTPIFNSNINLSGGNDISI